MPVLLAIIAALGGLAFWRRKKLGEDAQRLKGAARQTVDQMRSRRKDLLVELGERTYAKSIGEEDADNEAEISRLISALTEIDASDKETEEDAEAGVEPEAVPDAAAQ